jgi:hypothetical protein
MAEKNRVALKSYFNTGDKPTEDNFADLVDSFVNRTDDAFVTTLPDAGESQKGIVQQATIAEAQAGVNNSKYVTAEGAKTAALTFSPVKSVNGQTGNVVLNLPVLQDSGWINGTLINAFTNLGAPYHVARYRKKNGIVYLEGVVRAGASNTIIMQLPVGFRPDNQLAFITSTSTVAHARIQITAGGDVIGVVVNTTFTSLSGITFVVD